ncbi:hypothetical protein [Croceicoccus gelatinilyticus]|uniref:hypothetical protein n=1 Tax=Croceicoccus gelatinilyticus TaxID=2835536 RepID=UPI001BD10E95|nr:hypothetical protein [Croceicoccus gelatinilyticus]MBS7671414.1 hypothetical protein [Croceicoccus gelatinilyticus]
MKAAKFMGVYYEATCRAVETGVLTSRKPSNRQYREFCGPILPTTRQQRRAMMRRAAKPLEPRP